MNSQIPDFIENRICNHTLSKYVVPGSTPVPFFGNFLSAKTYTIGINPSVKEFSNTKGELLNVKQKRLQDFETLNIQKREFPYPISREHARTIFDGCLHYFTNNPYKWFDRLESTVNGPLNSSYFDGTACHLDLVQWATNPIWGKVLERDLNDAKYLLEQDLPFLKKQVWWLQENNPNLKSFFLSGRTVIESLQDIFKLKSEGKTNVLGKKIQYDLYLGEFNGVPVFATTMNIPNSRTSDEHRELFRNWIRERNI